MTASASSSSSMLPTGPVEIKLMKVEVIKSQAGLGLSIAGGKGSDPYKGDDEGIFVSKITDGGAASQAGLMVGDKLLSVNEHSLKDVDHYTAVKILKSCGSRFVAHIEREVPIICTTPAPSVASLMMIPQQQQVGHVNSTSVPPASQYSVFTSSSSKQEFMESGQVHQQLQQQQSFPTSNTSNSHLHQQQTVNRQFSSPVGSTSKGFQQQPSPNNTSPVKSNGDVFNRRSASSMNESSLRPAAASNTSIPPVVPSPRGTRTSSVTLSAAKSVDLLTTSSLHPEVARPEMLISKGDNKKSMIFHTTLIRDSNGLGFSIRGAKSGEDTSCFFISRIAEGGAADKDGKIKIGDKILKIGCHEVEGATHKDVVSWLMTSDRFVRLVLEREVDPSTTSIEEVLFARDRESLSAATSRSNLSTLSGGMYSSNSYMANRPSFTGSYRRPTLGSMGSMSSLSERGGNAVLESNPSSPTTPTPGAKYSIHTRLPGLRNNTSGDLVVGGTLPSRVSNIVANINSATNTAATLPRDHSSYPSSQSYSQHHQTSSSHSLSPPVKSASSSFTPSSAYNGNNNSRQS